MNKCKPKLKLKRGNWKQNGATPYPLKQQRRDKTLSMAETVKRNKESFNALKIFSGSGGNLDDPIRIQRSKSLKHPTALQP
jgi:hypothetical protein